MYISYFNLCMILGRHTVFDFCYSGGNKIYFLQIFIMFSIHSVMFTMLWHMFTCVVAHVYNVVAQSLRRYISLKTVFKSLPLRVIESRNASSLLRQCYTPLPTV